MSLGCPKNLVDSEKMLGLLAQTGLTPVSHDPSRVGFAGADAVVVNTCGFLEASKDESLSVIREAIAAKERGEVRRVVVAGCLVQRHRAKMLDWAPGIDAMVGVFDRDKIVQAVTGAGAPREKPGEHAPPYWIAANALQAARANGRRVAGLTVNGKDAKGIGYFEDDSARLRLTPRHYAYLRVSEGCNQNCAFCTIPSIRGKMRSKPVERILAEARELLHDGAFELLLIGQDTTSYGDDIGIGLTPGARDRGLPGLLRALVRTVQETSGQGWLRLMYAYPSNFSHECVDAFRELCAGGILCPYLDIPLQHASDAMLTAMRRNVSARAQEDLIHRLRDAVPDIAIRTTFISGFPGETTRDHDQLVAFVERMRFDAVGVFEYSKEPGTVAGTMEDNDALRVPGPEKARRRAEIMEAQQRVAFARNRDLASRFEEPAAGRPHDKPRAMPPARVQGEVVDVLIDRALASQGRATAGVSAGGRLFAGRTSRQAPEIDAMTFVQSRGALAPGELVRCIISGEDGYDLIARPVDDLEKRVGLNVLR